MDVNRFVWVGVVLGFAAIAILAPVVIIKENVGDGAAASGPGNLVTMARIAFSPETLTVRRGTEVLFENADVAPHTVTSSDAGVESGVINPGKSFRLEVSEPFEYICSIHPSMLAKIELSG